MSDPNTFTIPRIELALQLLTLFAILYYAYLTRCIAKEASKQSEQSLIPCLLIRGLPDVSDDLGLEEMLYQTLPARIVFENVGRGPALNGWFELYDSTSNSGPIYREAIPFVRPEGTLQSHWQSPNAVPKSARFLIVYESLGGIRYETEVPVEVKRLGPAMFRKSSHHRPSFDGTGLD